jgi:hypothetical protein
MIRGRRLAALVVLFSGVVYGGDNWKFTASQPVFRVAEKQPDWYLVCFSASWCGPCKAWQRDHLEATRKVLPVVVIDVDSRPEWKRSSVVTAPSGVAATIQGVLKYPTFWLVHRKSRYPVARWEGGKSAEQVRRLIPPVVPTWSKDTEAAPALPE